jgi:transcriptional regulator with XRE-family HTH domain
MTTADSASSDQAAVLMGHRIRRLREESGTSLRAQAAALGIAPSSLSALENNQPGVSLKRLQLVAQYFGLHITDLLGTAVVESAETPIEIIRNCASSVKGMTRGKGVMYQLLGSGTDHAIQPYLLSFEPSGSFERDMIGHPGEEFAYVLQGEVDLVFEGESHRLTAGDSVRFRTHRPHAFRNSSPAGYAMVVGAATPPW